MGVPESLALAESLLISTGGLELAAIKRLLLTASRSLDVEPPDPATMVIDQIQVTAAEALELYENLTATAVLEQADFDENFPLYAGVDLSALDAVDDESEDPLDFILAIANWYAANLPPP